MKPLLDLTPFALFAATFFLFTSHDFFVSTIVLMSATALQVALTWLITRTVSKQLWATFWLIMVLGGLTVVLRNKTFLFWKPTLVSLAFAIALLVGQAIGKNPLRLILGGQLTLPDKAWRHLSYGWAAGFVLEAVLNLYVAFNFSESFWVLYKLWGSFGLTFLYIICTGVYLAGNGLLNDATMQQRAAATATSIPPLADAQQATAKHSDSADGRSHL